jgi:hypothetical protein
MVVFYSFPVRRATESLCSRYQRLWIARFLSVTKVI